MSTQQKALLLTGKNGDFVLGTRPIPQPGPGELLIKIRATALNPFDWKLQRLGFFVEGAEYPAVIGGDIAGDIVRVGDDVTGFKPGDRVFGPGLVSSDFSSFQEYCKANQDFVAKIPPAVSYDEASTFSMALLAAYLGLYNKPTYGIDLEPLVPSGKDKYTNQPILILGGATSVGQFAIQLAKASGFSPIITTASSKHADRLKPLGVTHIIDRHTPLTNLESEITNQVGKQLPIYHIFDAISSEETQVAAYKLLAPGGKLGLVFLPVVPNAELNHPEKQVSFTYGYADSPQNTALVKTLYAHLANLIKNGTLVPSIVEVIPGGLGGIAEGLRRLENNQVSGTKLVARPHEYV